MHVIRPVRSEDEESLSKLISGGGMGITTLPHQPELLRLKIQHSLKSFSTQESLPKDEKYFFVLEDLDTHEIGGCCAIFSKSGMEESDDYYQVQYEHPDYRRRHQPEKLELLKVVSYRNGPSMLCSLFLSHQFRREGLGRLLSLCRFMFIASFPRRFTETVIANIRGFFDENGHSPFWEGLGRYFYDVDFKTLLDLQEVDKKFIADILPKHPIYTCLLPQSAKETIGKAHPNSVPAQKMLMSEGFSQTNEVDPFDAGPKLSAELVNLRCIKSRSFGRITQIASPIASPEKWIISNDKLSDFRACYGEIEEYGDQAVCINPAVARALNVDIGDSIFYIAAHLRTCLKSSIG